MKSKIQKSRRQFLRTSARGAVLIPLSGLLTYGFSTSALAETPKLDPADPLAAGLKYTHDASSAARATPADDCAICMQYTDKGDGWGDCKIFPGKLVAAKGWCSAYVKKV